MWLRRLVACPEDVVDDHHRLARSTLVSGTGQRPRIVGVNPDDHRTGSDVTCVGGLLHVESWTERIGRDSRLVANVGRALAGVIKLRLGIAVDQARLARPEGHQER